MPAIVPPLAGVSRTTFSYLKIRQEVDKYSTRSKASRQQLSFKEYKPHQVNQCRWREAPAS